MEANNPVYSIPLFFLMYANNIDEDSGVLLFFQNFHAVVI